MSKSLKLYGGSALGAVALFAVAFNFADRNITPMPERADVMGEAPSNPDLGFIAMARAASEPHGNYNLGRMALPEEIAAWNLDVSPDGNGLARRVGRCLDR